MKAETFVTNWLNRKYGGAKEVGEWSYLEVCLLLGDFQKQIWDEVQEVAFETDETDDCFSQELVELDDLQKILEIEE